MTALDPHYDRAAASAIIARLAAGLFDTAPDIVPQEISYSTSRMVTEPDSHLTAAQQRYLEKCMAPCTPSQVTSATHRITWTDSSGVPNTGYYGPSELGPIMPIAAREAVLALWRHLGDNAQLRTDAAQLPDADFAVLAATTTDHEPLEIFRIGIEAAGRALAQHALVAGQAGFRGPAAFAEAMRASRLYAAVASTWYWELQASTYRRGMVPVHLFAAPDGRVRYTPDTVAVLSAMKKRTIADAHAVMRRAMETEGLSAAAAVRKYHTDLDVISRQYALLPAGAQPVCLAQMPNTIAGKRVNVLSQAADAFTDTVIALLGTLRITEVPVPPLGNAAAAGPFQVPDMNCRHCKLTITTILEAHGADVADVNLVTKNVVATFGSAGQRDAAFAVIQNSGYTVVAAAG